MGRHSAPDPDTEPETAALDAVSEPETGPETDSGPAPGPAAGAPLPPGSRGDLQLLRTRPRLQAACAGAVVVCFAIFTVVLIVLGRSDLYLIWLWVPIVVSGVAIGALLDRAHRSLDRPR